MIKINIKKITTGKWKENCYIISKSIREALIIDPGDDKEKIENYLHINDFSVQRRFNQGVGLSDYRSM